ncbi:carbohydrate ABC transporter membrane protein 1 (CUT1 family) [Hydrogenispora ethanolica]|uniref:Carbohydrate ABC transporter membrane protein 1 (CUT1 family) n=2 Tax=Hydrogenispora ethanolica TaxID=1082276 RepID=A0A4R1R947_HYDET|nr:carbohydrate ABC transporter membrane protein 1 (CUT1 family) [Hydrogenispora ethanolica]
MILLPQRSFGRAEAPFQRKVMMMADSNSKSSSWLVVAAFLLPSFLGFFLFVLVPMMATVGLAFTDYSGGFTYQWIGLKNFVRAFTSTSFINALTNTVNFTVVSVVAQIVLGFCFAVLLNKKIVARNFFRAVIFLPVVLSMVAISLVFMVILHPDKGPINGFLTSLGMTPIPWLTSPKTALLTIILVTIWQSFGYYMILFLSGLQAINLELYEAADIDGASKWRQLWNITIPMLSPTTFFCVIMAIINSFKVFDPIFVMTGGQLGGGPGDSTTVLVFDIYKNAFSYYKMGYASAEAVILLLIVLVVTIIQYRGQKKWVTYDL